MDEGDGVVIAHGPAAVDDLLTAAFHFGIVALDAGEIEILAAGAAGHGAGRAAAETDEHGRAAEHDEAVAGQNVALLHVAGADIAKPSGEHDGFVIAADFLGVRVFARGGHFLFEGAEVAVDGGATEFVVEGGTTEGAFDHDIESGNDAAGFAVGFFPRLFGSGDAEIGNGETGQTGLGSCSDAGGTLIADLPAGTGCGTGERRDCGGVIVRFDLAENVDVLVVGGVALGVGIDKETSAPRSGEDGGVVTVGGEDALAVELVGVADHRKERFLLLLSVDIPRGVKDFVAAVLGVGLRKHHQLDVVGIAFEFGESFDEVIDLILGQSESERGIGGDEGSATFGEDRHGRERTRFVVVKEHLAGFERIEDGLGHAVVEVGCELARAGGCVSELTAYLAGRGSSASELAACGRRLRAQIDRILDHALDALHLVKSADVSDIGGFGGPGGNRAGARGDDLGEPGD